MPAGEPDKQSLNLKESLQNPERPGLDNHEKKMIRDAGVLSVLTMISRVLGLVREMTKARFLGTGMLGDAFTVAFIIPNFMRRLFAEGSVSVAFIPTFKGYLHEDDRKATEEFLSASLTVLTILVSSIVALGIVFAPWIVKAFGSDPSETAILTRIMFPFLALVSFAALLQGILNSYGIFAPSGFAPILFNLCFIIVPWMVSSLTANPARAMAIGVVAGGFAQALCQLPAVLKTGSKFGFIAPRKAFKNAGMRKVFMLIAPTILGMAAYQINDLVSTAFASRAGLGTASSLQYSLRLQELILGVFAVSAGTVLLPSLADAVKESNWLAYSSRLGRTLQSIFLATIPVTVFSMIANTEIVTLLFKWGSFSEESVRLTASAFFWHQTGLSFIAANRIIAPAFYARSDTKTPTFAGIASFAVNIALVMLLSYPFKGPGIALALSLSSLVNTILLVTMLIRTKTAGIAEEFAKSARYALKLLVFSIASGAVILALRVPLLSLFAGRGRLVSAGLPLIIMTLLYAGFGIAMLALSKDPLALSIVKAVRKRSFKN